MQYIARWETKGKDWLDLYATGHGYSYRGNGCGGSLPKLETDEEAIAYMEAGPCRVLKFDRPSLKRVM